MNCLYNPLHYLTGFIFHSFSCIPLAYSPYNSLLFLWYSKQISVVYLLHFLVSCLNIFPSIYLPKFQKIPSLVSFRYLLKTLPVCEALSANLMKIAPNHLHSYPLFMLYVTPSYEPVLYVTYLFVFYKFSVSSYQKVSSMKSQIFSLVYFSIARTQINWHRDSKYLFNQKINNVTNFLIFLQNRYPQIDRIYIFTMKS